jgi:hypothetical protein
MAEMQRLRYAMTDLLDDLTHSRDDGETATISAVLWLRTAELALHAGRHWLGGGKWFSLSSLRVLRWAFQMPSPSSHWT